MSVVLKRALAVVQGLGDVVLRGRLLVPVVGQGERVVNMSRLCRLRCEYSMEGSVLGIVI